MYEFSTSQALGLTAMVQARDTSETLLGVFAMDFDVGALSAIVNGSLSGEGAWGFAVERGNGLLVAITTGEKLYDKAAVAQVGFANSRLRAADVAHPSIAAAATFLAEQNWPANLYHRAGNLSVGYEFQSDELTLNGLDWLVVVGMDIRCGENEVWTSAGRCSVCPGGTHPAESGLLCEVCPSGTAGGDGNCMPCQDGAEPNGAKTSCVSCVNGFAGTGGERCDACRAGTFADAGASTCSACIAGRYDDDGDAATPCVLCPAGSFSAREGQTECLPCKVANAGTTSLAGSVDCGLCDIGYYNYIASSSSLQCTTCNQIETPRRPAPLSPLTSREMMNEDICPGGAPGSAIIIPQGGLWVHLLEDGTPELLACENDVACMQANRSSWPSGASGGICDGAYSGFMCRLCADGFAKIDGRCVRCEGLNWSVLLQSLAVSLIMAMVLLQSATNAVVSVAEFHLVWGKVDVHHTGYLDKDGIIAVLKLLGLARTDAETIATELLDKIGISPPFFEA